MAAPLFAAPINDAEPAASMNWITPINADALPALAP